MWIWASTPSSTVPEGNSRPFTTILYRAVVSSLHLPPSLPASSDNGPRPPLWPEWPSGLSYTVSYYTCRHGLFFCLPNTSSSSSSSSSPSIIIIIILVVLMGKGGRCYFSGVQTGLIGVQERSKRICGSFFAIGFSFSFYSFFMGLCYRKSLVLKRKRNDKTAHPYLRAIPERRMDGRRYGPGEVGVLHELDASRLMPFQSYLLYYITLLYTRRHHDHHRYHGGLARNWRDTCWEGWHGWIEA